MLRFVVLRHECPATYKLGVHWDFMLEASEVLRTWSLPAPPDAGGSLDACQLPDHRLMYLDYEGPLSGDRGSVSRWDWGEFTTLLEGPDRLVVRLSGSRLRGRATLTRETETATQWRFEFRSDDATACAAESPG